MRFAYTIIYVPDVEAALGFYERAFGLTRSFLSDEGLYGALDTGSTTLAFVGYAQADTLGFPYRNHDATQPGAAFEIALATDDVDADYARAVAAGATPLVDPADKPWGERIAYVRDPNGVHVELAQKL